MKKHQKYDLWMHDNRELSNLLEFKIVQRQTIHQWPNSCVQKVEMEDGSKWIYKSQSGITIESSFYEKAHSPILPRARTLWKDSWYSCMLIEYLDAPVMGQLKTSETKLLEISSELVEAIADIEGDYPVLLDIRSYSQWCVMATETLGKLRKLIKEKHQYGSGPEDIASIEKTVCSPLLESCFSGKTGLIHGDLNGGNLFQHQGGYKIIDWQSCKLAPIELDQANFLSRQGVDPAKYFSKALVYMLYFTGIWWLIQCQTLYLPEENYDKAINYFITRMKQLEI